jgi:hypothetical protein
MASTRDINQPGNYEMEQESLKRIRQSILYPHSYAGRAYQTNFSGNGLCPPRIGSAQLSKNFVDIESRLYGISSCNLVNPQKPLTPELNRIDSLSIFEKTPVIVPEKFEPLKEQRLRLYHSDSSIQRQV